MRSETSVDCWWCHKTAVECASGSTRCCIDCHHDQPDTAPNPGQDRVTDSAAPCPQGRTDYEACFAPFRYCPVKGCGRTESSTPDAPTPTYLDGLRDARAVVERQTNLADLMHFDRPSDFRKGVLSSLAALDDAIRRAESGD